MSTTPSIRAFYAGSTVLVTGGNGFLGKAIIEKLLRTCTDIKSIYTLLRDKKGVSCEDRFAELKANQVLNVSIKFNNLLFNLFIFYHLCRYLTE